jgi:hypothetical protein
MIYHTKDGVVLLSPSQAAPPVRLPKMTEWTLDMTGNDIDVTNFDSTNQEFLKGWPARRGTLAGFWDDSNDTLFDASESPTGAYLYLYMTARSTSHYWWGPCNVDASIRANVAEVGRVTATFTASGQWFRA